MVAASASPLPEPGDAAELGVDGFLLKPFEPEPLRALLTSCLGLRWTHAGPGVDAASPDRVESASAEDLDDLVPGPSVMLPPEIELEAGAELAARGDWPALREWCAELTYSDSGYTDFTAHVLAVADAVERAPSGEAEILALRSLLVRRD